MVATGVELLFIAQKRGFVNSVDCPDAQILLITNQNVFKSSVTGIYF